MPRPSSIDPFDIYKVTVMVAGNQPPRPVDTLFFHGRSFGDETGLFELAGNLYHQGLVKHIVLFDTEGEREGESELFKANRGKTAYTKDLRKIGVKKRDIFYGGPGTNTKTEIDGFLSIATENSWNSVAVMSHPHQILRTMLSLVKSMDEQNYWIYAYSATPPFSLWQEKVHGSQDLESKSREEHVQDEFVRIPRYQKQGSLASFEELFGYLRKRELELLIK